MYSKRLIIVCLCLFQWAFVEAQQSITMAEADTKSLQLYNAGKWQELLQYGKLAQANGIDFSLLKMRIGYSAFMLGNYSQSLTQYQKVLLEEPDNRFALYYVYLNHKYLNNTTAERFYGNKLADDIKKAEQLSSIKIANIETEFSYKAVEVSNRGNATYGRLGLGLQLGYGVELQQSVAYFNQNINEPKLTNITNNKSIDIQQREYYAKLIIAASGNVSLLGGFHYLYTPFNNKVFNNTVVFGGLKITTPYVHLKLLANFAIIADSSYQQFDASVTTYPFGSLKFYTISKFMYGKSLNFSQIIGTSITKNIWIEGHTTLGNYTNLIDNDGLYVYNDIDTKTFRIGGAAYFKLSKNVTFSINYNFDQKERYLTKQAYFNQHSTTGGLTWKF